MAARRTLRSWSFKAIRTAFRAAALSIRVSDQTALRRDSGEDSFRVRVRIDTASVPFLDNSLIARLRTAGRGSPNNFAKSVGFRDVHGSWSPRGSFTFGAPLRRTR